MNLGLLVAATRTPAHQDARATAGASIDSAPVEHERSFADALAALSAGVNGLPVHNEDAEDDEAAEAEGERPAMATVPELAAREVISRTLLTASTSSAGDTLEPPGADDSSVDVETPADGSVHSDAAAADAATADAVLMARAQTQVAVAENPGPVAQVPTWADPPAETPQIVSGDAPHTPSSATHPGPADVPVAMPASGSAPGHTGQLPAAAAHRAGVRAFAHHSAPEPATTDLGAVEAGPLVPTESTSSEFVTDPRLATRKDEAATYAFEKRAWSVSAARPGAEAPEAAVPSGFAGEFGDSGGESRADREHTRELPSPATRVAIDQTIAAAVSNRAAATGDTGPQSFLPIAGPVVMPRAATALHTPADPRGPMSASAIATATALASTLAPAPPSSLPGETSSQIVQSLRLQLSHGGGTAHIRLEPQYFGELHVSIRVDQGRVVARLEAESPAVREWIQTNQAWLRSSLAEHNLTLDRIEVNEVGESRQGERRQGDAPGSEREAPPRQRRRRPETGELFEVVA